MRPTAGLNAGHFFFNHILPQGIIFNRLTEDNLDPMFHYQAQVQGETAISDKGVSLLPNSPNPFIEMTLLWFNLPEAADITLRVLDSHGHVVSTKSGRFPKGENHLVLQRSDIREPGIYLYRIETPFGSASRRLVMY